MSENADKIRELSEIFDKLKSAKEEFSEAVISESEPDYHEPSKFFDSASGRLSQRLLDKLLEGFSDVRSAAFEAADEMPAVAEVADLIESIARSAEERVSSGSSLGEWANFNSESHAMDHVAEEMTTRNYEDFKHLGDEAGQAASERHEELGDAAEVDARAILRSFDELDSLVKIVIGRLRGN